MVASELQPGRFYWWRASSDSKWETVRIHETWLNKKQCLHRTNCVEPYGTSGEFVGPIPTPDDPRWKALVGG